MLAQRYYVMHDEEVWLDFFDEPRIGGLISYFRCVYDRYPKSKEELLQFHIEECMYEPFDMHRPYVTDRELSRIIRNKNNVLQVSGDSCSFFIKDYKISYTDMVPAPELRDYGDVDASKSNEVVIAKRRRIKYRIRNLTYKFVGGPIDIQTDYRRFTQTVFVRCFDKDGKRLRLLQSRAPFLDTCIRRQFQYCIVFDAIDQDKSPDDSIGLLVRSINQGRYPQVMMPVSLNRSGAFFYDLSHIQGWTLYYRDNPSSIYENNGSIKLEDAIDQEYINAIRSHLEEFLRQHPEVETIKTWEYLLFNDPPKEGDSTSYL